jgi:transposase InsO family protein
MKFSFIDARRAEFPVARLCEVLEVSRSGCFAWKNPPRVNANARTWCFLLISVNVFACRWDRGSRYCSYDYQRMLGQHGFIPSMSGKGNCYDSTMVETVFKTIKSELIWRTGFHSRRQVENAIARYIDGFYNPVRRHSALGDKSPIKFEDEAEQETMALH